MSAKIWQPEHPTPGWRQAKEESHLTIHIPLEPDLVVPMFFRRIPAGKFRMGSRGNDTREEPVHLVKIPEAFYLGTFPVTRLQYRALVSAFKHTLVDIHGYDSLMPWHFHCDLHPLTEISWDGAMALCRELSEAEFFRDELLRIGLVGKWLAGLPSEAIWEYACRDGTESDFWGGDGEASLAELGWHGNYFLDTGQITIHPVGKKGQHRPSGLYDMHGNVSEFCSDVRDWNAYRTFVDGGNAASGSNAARKAGDDLYRVSRGGTDSSSADFCRSAYRVDSSRPDFPDVSGSFRLCVFPVPGDGSLEPEAKPGAESTACSGQPRDEAKQAQAAGGVPAVDLSQKNFSVATRAGK